MVEVAPQILLEVVTPLCSCFSRGEKYFVNLTKTCGYGNEAKQIAAVRGCVVWVVDDRSRSLRALATD